MAVNEKKWRQQRKNHHHSVRSFTGLTHRIHPLCSDKWWLLVSRCVYALLRTIFIVWSFSFIMARALSVANFFQKSRISFSYVLTSKIPSNRHFYFNRVYLRGVRRRLFFFLFFKSFTEFFTQTELMKWNELIKVERLRRSDFRAVRLLQANSNWNLKTSNISKNWTNKKMLVSTECLLGVLKGLTIFLLPNGEAEIPRRT